MQQQYPQMLEILAICLGTVCMISPWEQVNEHTLEFGATSMQLYFGVTLIWSLGPILQNDSRWKVVKWSRAHGIVITK